MTTALELHDRWIGADTRANKAERQVRTLEVDYRSLAQETAQLREELVLAKERENRAHRHTAAVVKVLNLIQMILVNGTSHSDQRRKIAEVIEEYRK